MNKVYECVDNGWVTEKECKTCYYKKMKHLYKEYQHCMEINIINIEITER